MKLRTLAFAHLFLEKIPFPTFWIIFSDRYFKNYYFKSNKVLSEVALGWDFLGIFHFGLDQKIPGEKSRKNPQVLGIFKIWRFKFPGFFCPEIFENLGIFIPEIRLFLNLGFYIPLNWEFLKSGDLYPGDWNFFGDRDFFRGMGYSTKKPPLRFYYNL